MPLLALEPVYPDQQAFRRLLVDFLTVGGGRVTWELSPRFADPLPYSFQLQASRVGVTGQLADWEDVGAPVTDADFAIDTEKRLFGKSPDLYYRVELTTSVGAYYSKPELCIGKLDMRTWLLAREMLRKEQLRHSVFTSQDGYLLKARRYGALCPICRDSFTEEILNSNDLTCYGTGWLSGYYTAQPATYADIGQRTHHAHRVAERGTVQEDVVTARLLGQPVLYTGDLWVGKASDERYRIEKVHVAAHLRGVPVVYEVELRLLAYTDVAYQVPLTSDVEAPTPPLLTLAAAASSGAVTATHQRGVQCQTTDPVAYLRATRAAQRRKAKGKGR